MSATIKNEKKGIRRDVGRGFDIVAKVASNHPDVRIEPDKILLGDIDPGKVRTGVVNIHAKDNLSDGKANITITAKEKRGDKICPRTSDPAK